MTLSIADSPLAQKAIALHEAKEAARNAADAAREAAEAAKEAARQLAVGREIAQKIFGVELDDDQICVAPGSRYPYIHVEDLVFKTTSSRSYHHAAYVCYPCDRCGAPVVDDGPQFGDLTSLGWAIAYHQNHTATNFRDPLQDTFVWYCPACQIAVNEQFSREEEERQEAAAAKWQAEQQARADAPDPDLAVDAVQPKPTDEVFGSILSCLVGAENVETFMRLCYEHVAQVKAYEIASGR